MLKDRWRNPDPYYQSMAHGLLSSGTAVGTAFEEADIRNGFSSLVRGTQLKQATGDFAERVRPEGAPTRFGDTVPLPTDDPEFAATLSPYLSPDEATARYGIQGELTFEQPIREDAAKLKSDWKRDEIRRRDILSRADPSFGPTALRLGAGFAASLTDPLNIAASFIPVVGQARYASWAARFGTTGARLRRGAIEGFVGTAALEPFIYHQAQVEDADYSALDSLLNLTFGTVLGGGLHVGGGAVSDVVGRMRFRNRATASA
jgi:hypothetical protein